MAPFPSASRLLSLVEDIKTAVERDDASNMATRVDLLANISKLRDAVEAPQDSLLRIYSQPLQNAALRVASELGLLQIISSANSPTQGMETSLAQLAGRSPGDSKLIARIMRVLTAMGICVEVGQGRYISNPLNEVIVQPGYTAGVIFLFDVEIPAIMKLVECLSKHQFQSPTHASQSAFDYAFGASLFDWMKENPATLRCFDLFMAGRRVGKTSWLDYYPIHERLIKGTNLENAIFMVDIGGGRGHDLMSLRDKYGHEGLPGRLILQDLAVETSEDTIAVFESMPHNFFEPQPVKGARVYHLRAILHDWPTSICRTILSHIASVMTPDYSKLIIREFILPDTNVPLYTACTDIRMMLLHAGMERTESQWKELLDGVGLELAGFWNVERGGEGVIEAVKRAKVQEQRKLKLVGTTESKPHRAEIPRQISALATPTSFALSIDDDSDGATIRCVDPASSTMTTDQPINAPTPSPAPPKRSSSPTSTRTTSLTARLHIPTTYTTLPSQWLSTYQTFVRSNSSQVSSLESALRSLTYLLPGTRFADTPLTSESLQTFLSLLTAYNTHLLASPPFSPQRRYERFWEAKSRIYARCTALLRTIQYTQLLLEMLAKRAGEKARWRLIVLLELSKAVCRLCMGRVSHSRPVIASGIGDERTERKTDVPAAAAAEEDVDYAEDSTQADGAAKEGEWKMPRTGMRLPQLPSCSSNGGGGGGGGDSIADFLTSRVIRADEIKSAHRLVRKLHTLPGHLAELFYILRPVLYALALQRCRANKRDWRPWLLGLSMEMAARQLSKADVEESVVGGVGGLSGVEREEMKRRGWGMLWWGMRGAFYENVTGGLVRGVAGRLKGKAVLDMVAVVVEDYNFLWGEYYFPTATL